MARTLVLGGARSGKSAHAEGLLRADAPATYVATARVNEHDQDWRRRIAAHVERRPARWRTIETAHGPDLPDLLHHTTASDPPLLVDDIATWLTGVLDDVGAWQEPTIGMNPITDGGSTDGMAPTAGTALAVARARCDVLVDAVATCPARLVLVSSEVGLGVVPATRSGRLFRDELGRLNAALAEACAEVVLLVAGIPLRLR